MLDAYIIDLIRQEELERERAFERRRIYLELPLPPLPERKRQDGQEEENGSIVVPFRPEMGVPDENAA